MKLPQVSIHNNYIMGDYIEINTHNQDENGVTRIYVIHKSPIPLGELTKLPTTVKRHHCKHTASLFDEMVVIKMDDKRKNVFVGQKMISLKQAGANIFINKKWVDHFTLFNGKFYGNGYKNGTIIKAFLTELGIPDIAKPLNKEDEDKYRFSELGSLLTKPIIKQLLSGKIKTREDLLLAYFKNKYNITTVSAETIEQIVEYGRTLASPITLKQTIEPSMLDYTFRRLMLMSGRKLKVFNQMVNNARDLGYMVNPTEGFYEMFNHNKRIVRETVDLLEKHNAIEGKPASFGYTVNLTNMVPITTPKQVIELRKRLDAEGDYIGIHDKNKLFFHYKKDNEEAIVIIDKYEKSKRLLNSFWIDNLSLIENHNLFRKELDKTLLKNNQGLKRMFESRIENNDTAKNSETLEYEDIPF